MTLALSWEKRPILTKAADWMPFFVPCLGTNEGRREGRGMKKGEGLTELFYPGGAQAHATGGGEVYAEGGGGIEHAHSVEEPEGDFI